MEKQLLKNDKPIERLATLENSADKVEEFSYTKPFTPDQLVIFKDQLSTEMIELKIVEDELQVIKDEYKGKMKPLKKMISDILTHIKYKSESVTEKCYVMIEGNEVGYYNAEGTLVYQRPVLAGEQKTIFSIKREEKVS